MLLFIYSDTVYGSFNYVHTESDFEMMEAMEAAEAVVVAVAAAAEAAEAEYVYISSDSDVGELILSSYLSACIGHLSSL
jgi:hypothetical protein